MAAGVSDWMDQRQADNLHRELRHTSIAAGHLALKNAEVGQSCPTICQEMYFDQLHDRCLQNAHPAYQWSFRLVLTIAASMMLRTCGLWAKRSQDNASEQ